MSNNETGERIRLTNKTARALYANARRDRKVCYWVIGVVSICMAVGAVYMGINRNLWLAPALIVLTALLDAALWRFSRVHYLDLTSQAICTEAAARAIQGEQSEMARREQARRELQAIKEDLVREAYARPEEPQLAPPQMEDDPQDDQPRRRRRQASFHVIHGEHVN